MTLLRRTWLRVRSLVLRGRLEREMQEEMAAHLDRAAERIRDRGLPPTAAARAAQREFGNVGSLQEEARDARGGRWLEAIVADTRFGLRHFARHRGTTITMLAVLGLGMSLNTALFSALHSYATQPPRGITHADNLVRIRGFQTSVATGDRVARALSVEELDAVADLNDHFRSIGGWTELPVALTVGDAGDQRSLAATVTLVTRNYFEVLGAQPFLGVGLPEGDLVPLDSARWAVISHATWNRLFGSDSGAIGTTLIVNGIPFTLMGVMSPGFGAERLWVAATNLGVLSNTAELGPELFRAAGLLQPGVTRSEATAAVHTVATRIASAVERPATTDPGTEVVSLLSDNDDPSFDRVLAVAMTAFAALGLLILLVTSTNTAALLTGLAMARQREIAIRLSLGAGRRRIIRQLLTESTLLAAVAGAIAMAVAYATWRLALTFLPGFPYTLAPSAGVLFTLAVSLGVGMLFGLSPALHATRIGIAAALKGSATAIAGARPRLQRRFVLAQIALTQPLMVVLVAALVILAAEYRGSRPDEAADQLISLQLRAAGSGTLGITDQSAEAARRRAEMERLLTRLRTTPGIVGAVPDLRIIEAASADEARAMTRLEGYAPHPDDALPGTPSEAFDMFMRLAAPGYFELTGTPITLGREFEPSDPGPPQALALPEMPVIIDADLARRLWPGSYAIGRRLQSSAFVGRAMTDTVTRTGPTSLVVVGVYEEPQAGPRPRRGDPTVYAAGARTLGYEALLIRTNELAEPLIPMVRDIVVEDVPSMAIASVRTVGEIDRSDRRSFFIGVAAMGGAVGLALLLSAIGLYAVIAFAVRQRTTEIAVRMAVGARAKQILATFLGEGLRLAAIGSAIGLPPGLFVLWLVRSSPDMQYVALEQVTAITVLAVVLIAVTATWIPARRAAGIHPAAVLRGD